MVKIKYLPDYPAWPSNCNENKGKWFPHAKRVALREFLSGSSIAAIGRCNETEGRIEDAGWIYFNRISGKNAGHFPVHGKPAIWPRDSCGGTAPNHQFTQNKEGECCCPYEEIWHEMERTSLILAQGKPDS